MTLSGKDRIVRLLGKATPGQRVMLGILTDEQIIALEGNDSDQGTVFPWLGPVSAEDPRVATALRSLVALGLVTPSTEDGGSPIPHDDIADILITRRGTRMLFLVERELAETKRWSYSYLYEGAVLEEQISDDGFHSFAVLAIDDFGSNLADMLAPLEATEVETMLEPRRYATAEEFIAATPDMPEIADSVAVSQVTMLNAATDKAKASAVYVSPSGVFIFRMLDGMYTLSQAKRNDLVELVYAMVDDTINP